VSTFTASDRGPGRRSGRGAVDILVLLGAAALACSCARPEARPNEESIAAPLRQRGKEAETFTLLFTGADLGVLEPCGCTEGMLGGIGRRATFLEAALPAGAAGCAVATGGLAGSELARRAGGSAKEPNLLDVLRFETLVMAFNEMGYAAAGLGPEELRLGLRRIEAAAQIADFPFVLTNVVFPGLDDLPFKRSHRVALPGRGGTAAYLEVYAIVSPAVAESIPEGGRCEPVEKSLLAAAEESPDAAFRVVLMRGSQEEAEELAARLEGPWLFIYSGPGLEPHGSEWGRPGRDRRVVTPGDHGRFVGLASLAPAESGEWALRRILFEPLDESIPASEKVRFPLEVYRQRIVLEKVLEGMAGRTPHPSGRRFVGSAACAECHPATHEILKGSRHGRAFATLVRAERDFDPGCISCHTDGFGFLGGFLSPAETPGLLDVGCESCHGPAEGHPEGGAPPAGGLPCSACHDSYHSPGFDQESAWKTIACVREH